MDATKNLAIRSAKMLFRIAKECQKEGKGDPRILKILVQFGNRSLKEAGINRTDQLWEEID